MHSLPIDSNHEIDDTDEENSDGEDDEFSYLMAFPEFFSICIEARQILVDLLNQAVHTSLDDDIINNIHPVNGNKINKGDFDSPIFWDYAAEACEVLLDRVEMFIQSVQEKSIEGFQDDTITTAIRRAGKAARDKAKGEWNQLIGSLVHMEVCLCYFYLYGPLFWLESCASRPLVSLTHMLIHLSLETTNLTSISRYHQ